MANTTITNLPTVTSLNGTEPLLGVQAGSSVQITTAQIVSLALGQSGNLPFPVSIGGTGVSTFSVANGILIGNGQSPLTQIAAPAGTNYILVGSSNGTYSWQPTIPVTAGVDSISFGTTGLTPSTAQSGVISVAFGSSPTAAGIYSPATNQIALSTASIQRLLIDVSGNITSTGTTSGTLTINGATAVLTAPAFIANESISGSLNQGAYSYGTLSYSDTNIFSSFANSVNSFNQLIVQNTNAGSTASTNILVSNNLGTNSTYFGEFGMNSSTFAGSGSFNLPNAVYLDSANADLVIGTTTSNAIHFVVNNGATDAATISSAGVFSLATALAVSSGGTGQSAALTQYGVVYGASTTAMGITAAGTTGQVLVATSSAAPSWTNALTGLTNLTATGAITFNTTTNNQSYTTTGAGTITISSGTTGSISNMGISGSTGSFTTLTASSTVTLSPANANVLIQPTGTGVVTIAPATLGTLNNVTIGNSTAAAGTFTALTATGAVTFNTTTNNQSYTTTGAGAITISSGTLGTINNMSIGATTASTGAFTFVGAGTASTATAFVTTAAGTTSVAPLKFTSGTNLTTAAAGAAEYNGTNLFFTPAGTARAAVQSQYFYRLGTATTLASATGNQAIFSGLASGVLLAATTTYEFEIVFNLVTSGTTSHTESFGFTANGGLTTTDVAFQVFRYPNNATTANAPTDQWNTAIAPAVYTGAITTAQNSTYVVRGTITTNVAGSLNPVVAFSAAPGSTSTISIGSFMRISPLTQTAALVNIGTWA